MFKEKNEIRKLITNMEIPQVNEEAVVEYLMAFEPFLRSDALFCYASMQGEFPTQGIIDVCVKLKKRVYLPVVKGDAMEFYEYDGNLTKGAFGISEPTNKAKSEDKADMCIVPGLAFGRDGARLGRGGGYYDKFLKNFEGYKLGLCYSTSLLDVPTEAHDVFMDGVLTEKGFVRNC